MIPGLDGNNQTAKRGSVTMMQLTLGLAGQEVDVQAILMTMKPRTNRVFLARFELGSLAFFRGLGARVLPCQIEHEVHTGKGLKYRVRSESGLRLTLPTEKLLSGWEADFPCHHWIDWGVFKLLSIDDSMECSDNDDIDRDEFFDEYGQTADDLLSAHRLG